jgi:hypothetical protein
MACVQRPNLEVQVRTGCSDPNTLVAMNPDPDADPILKYGTQITLIMIRSFKFHK